MDSTGFCWVPDETLCRLKSITAGVVTGASRAHFIFETSSDIFDDHCEIPTINIQRVGARVLFCKEPHILASTVAKTVRWHAPSRACLAPLEERSPAAAI